MPQVSFQILIPGAGGYYDPAEMPGLAAVTAAMMREGTTTRTTQQIAELLETMAATVDGRRADCRQTRRRVSGSSLTENFDDAVRLLARHPAEPDVPEGRARALQAADAGRPDSAADDRRVSRERDVRRRSSTARIRRPHLADRRGARRRSRATACSRLPRTRYVPDHAVLAIAGDISMAEARKDGRGASSPRGRRPARRRRRSSIRPIIGAAKVSFVARPNSVQTSLWVGTQAISRTSPDYDIVQVMNTVIGGGPTGRLFIHLREEKGYTYGAYSNIRRASSAAVGWRRPMCGPRSPSRRCAI